MISAERLCLYAWICGLKILLNNHFNMHTVFLGKGRYVSRERSFLLVLTSVYEQLNSCKDMKTLNNTSQFVCVWVQPEDHRRNMMNALKFLKMHRIHSFSCNKHQVRACILLSSMKNFLKLFLLKANLNRLSK